MQIHSNKTLRFLIVVGVLSLFLPFIWASIDLLGFQFRLDLLEHRQLGLILISSLSVAFASASLAVCFGLFAALSHTLYRLPLVSVCGVLILTPLVCPTTVWAMAQDAFLGEGGLVNHFLGDIWNKLFTKIVPGKYLLTTLIFAQITMPLCIFIFLRGFKKLESEGWIAAHHYLSKTKLWWWIICGLKSEIITSFLLVFSLSLGNFAVPHAIQCRLISIEIYSQAINFLDREGAILGSLAVLVIAMFPAAFLALNFQRKEKVLQPSEVINFHQKSWLRLFIILSCFGYLVIFSVVPLLALIIQCGDVKVFIQAVRVSIPEAFNSLVIASGCALLAGLLPWAAVCGGPRRHSTIWEFINLWAIGVSPLVIALVCSRIGSMFGSRISSITIANAILCYALLLRVWPYAFRTISSGHEQYHDDWKATAQMARVPKLQQITKIGLPHYLPYVGLSMVLAFSLSIGEIEISQMLCAPGYGTLALRLMTFLHFAPANEVAGLALFQMLIALTPIFVGFACYKKLFKFL